MSYKLTEKEKTLLSAYHDGELSSSEYAEAEKLLGHSVEAREWLRGADTVRKLSLTAAIRPDIGSRSAKLTGSAIAAVAARTAGVGTVSYMIHSPWTAVGVLSFLLVGALYLMNPFATSGEQQVSPNTLTVLSEDTNLEPVVLAANDTKSMVPPITPRDLIGFALDGLLPVNADRTTYLAAGSSNRSEEGMLHELESGLTELGTSHLLTLDSLAKLLRSAVLQAGNGTYVVRQDLSALREDIIEEIEHAPLSAKTSTRLTEAKQEAQQVHERVEDRLAAEMDRMRKGLMQGGGQPYVSIDVMSLSEGPTGDRRTVLSLEQVGQRSGVVFLNPEEILVRDQNTNIAALIMSVPTRSTKQQSRRTQEASDTDKGLALASASSGTLSESLYQSWEEHVTSVYMADVTITLTSNRSQIIISNDEETTLKSDLKENSSTFYTFGAYLTKLTDSLNATVSRIVVDTATSARERAGQILQVQDDYRQRVERMIEAMRRQQEKIEDRNSTIDSGDDAASVEKAPDDLQIDAKQRANSTLKEAAQVTSPCPSWENCTGVS